LSDITYDSNNKGEYLMDSINSNTGTGAEIYAMKKAMDVQSEGVMKLLDSAQASSSQPNPSSGSSVTGIGQTLDIRA
jgi:hypothetical protein